MIMTLLYRLIVLLVLILVGRDFYKEDVPSAKINACMVMVPLLLRVLMIK